jgi:hypothetical protein
MGEEMRILSIHPCGTSRVLLHAVNVMTRDLPALHSIREKDVLRIFIALKNPAPWPGSNPQSLGPVASTLTTTTPSRHPMRNENMVASTAFGS